MSEKKVKDYEKLIGHLDIDASQLLMVGNSLKSDILPLVEMGASAIHIPFHTTWAYEEVSPEKQTGADYRTVQKMTDILEFFK